MTIFRLVALPLRALCLGLLALCAMAAWAQKPGAPITLNFVGADIEGVARTMGIITGRTMVVDPRVKGTINLSSEKPVAADAAYEQFLAALRLQGFTVVETAGLSKVLPEAEGKLQGTEVAIDADNPGGNRILTRIFRLDHENANNLVAVLRPLISPNNTINVNPGNNSLVITDYADNLKRLARVIAAMDLPSATEVEVWPLKHALAVDLAPLVLRLTQSGATGAGQGQADGAFRTAVVAEPRSNALIVRAANPARVALIRSLVERLDQPSSKDAAGNIHVVYLKNADATKLAVTLRAALAGTPVSPTPAAASATGAAAATAAAASAPPSTGGQIQADPATNALVITAPEPQYRQLRAVIDLLDQRRAQVFVESLIAEVNADRAAEFGIQWQGALGKNGDSSIGLLGTNFGAGGTNIVSLASGAIDGTVAPAKGLNIGIANRTNGVYVLGTLARFLQNTGDGNILSTPNLLTLDNEEAKIVIGQNVPFVTGSFTNTSAGSSGAVNPFQTIERKDVGLTLRVRPQISESGTVKLTIFQEVSSVQASSINSPTGLITNKRSIESSVLVDDGSIVVLGGLLQDEYAGNQEKVPGLGDVPFFGNLFKSETRSRKKTNLMVFLRPVVVRDAAAVDALSMDRYQQMRTGQQGLQPSPNPALPISDPPVLPAAALRVAPSYSPPTAPAPK
ncbi:MAG: type II secretion system protein GspD [Betaproteobacteria bacterium]|nr:type II secretion system protein GspD [Betaproteobacteria bacterium]